MKSILYTFLIIMFFSTSKSKQSTQIENLTKYLPNNTNLEYNGRGELLANGNYALVGSASSVAISFLGDHCEVFLTSTTGQNSYIAVELDGEYLGRYKVDKEMKPFTFKTTTDSKEHILTIFKATEATTGAILFNSVKVEEILPIKSTDKKYIEFIGDSITCGALVDDSEIPCETGKYTDHHNAYLAYGPRVAKSLDIEFMLSSVSGIGMYRNWNDENILEPIMPDVYENLYLNTDKSKPFSFTKTPDLVSICLGTNDMSNGDGKRKRLPFNADTFTQKYIKFIEMIYSHYPNTKIALLNSPMITEENNEILMACLKNIKAHFKTKNISIFEFNKLYVTGCNYHPSVKEQQAMADKLAPFYNQILNN